VSHYFLDLHRQKQVDLVEVEDHRLSQSQEQKEAVETRESSLEREYSDQKE
jgi:hypothetical protein